MSTKQNGEYWNRIIETSRQIAETSTNVQWLVKETKNQNIILGKHDERLNHLESKLTKLCERRNLVINVVKFCLGIVGIKI